MSHASTHGPSPLSDGKLSSVRNEVAHLHHSLHTSARDVADHGKRAVKAAGFAAKDAALGLRDSATDIRDRVGKTVSDRPFTSIAVAAAAGALVMGVAMWWRRRS